MSQITVTKINRNVTVTSNPSANINVNTGAAGNPHGTYTHSQASAASVWIITHNLNCKPAVTIVDSGGNVQIGEILYNSNNQVTVTFAVAFSGYAYLN